MTLPDGGIVYENTQIITGVPLTWGEMTAGCTRIPTTNELIANALKLTEIFGELRERWNSPIIITSGYRPPSENAKVGGAKNSQHLYFRALDCYPENGNLNELWHHAFNSRFTGLGDGRKRGFIHLDIRPGNRVVFNY